jgi:pimeloyl-ACP methyl ester carboxylesterase
MWRYRRFDGPGTIGEAAHAERGVPDWGSLWDALAGAAVPVLLVRGMLAQSVVDDADEQRFLEVVADPMVARVENAGHSVQGDTPVELAAIITDFVAS